MRKRVEAGIWEIFIPGIDELAHYKYEIRNAFFGEHGVQAVSLVFNLNRFKWNMGWMHDFLQYMSYEPIYRRYHQGEATFSMTYIGFK